MVIGVREAGSATDEATLYEEFDDSLKATGQFPLTSEGISTFQINMGKLCNQSCRHCHVDAGPDRTEVMSKETMELCLEVLRSEKYPIVDITGGSPEMNPHYRWFVKSCAALGCHVKTRTNLTILREDGYEDLPAFLAENMVEVIASLPCYLPDTAERQRGRGTFYNSIEALKELNSLGYGIDGGPVLNLVYNPCGAFLPPAQQTIEADFRRELKKRYGVTFSNLFTITNMPVGRFLKFLEDSGNLERYTRRLQDVYNPSAATKVMCRHTLSVGWDGSLYDCDFNQMLDLKCDHGAPDHIRYFDGKRLSVRKIVTGLHCYGCTAGAGSSCTGTVV